MKRRTSWSVGIAVGVSALALAACDPATWNRSEASEDASSEKIACVDPETGELIQPGPDVECRVPAGAKANKEPVVEDLEGGGKKIDLDGALDKNQTAPAAQNRLAVIDPRTGKLMGPRPTDAKAAARYDRIMTRANLQMKRQAAGSAAGSADAALTTEPLEGGGIMVDLKGRFQHPLVATFSKDGKVQLGHQPH